MSILRVTAVVDICVDGSWFSFVNIIELPRHSRRRGRYKGRSYPGSPTGGEAPAVSE